MDIGRYSRRDVIKGGLGLAGILAFGKAPGIIVKSMMGMRQGMVSGDSLPYDAEVQWIGIRGSIGQYCNLGVQPDVNTVFRTTLSFESGTGWLHCGYHTSATEYSNYRIFKFGGNRQLYFDLGQYNNQGGRCIYDSINFHETYDLEFGNNYIKVNGDVVVSKDTSTTTLTPMDFIIGSDSSGGGDLKIYSCQLIKGGILVRDIVPVRVGDVGYLYDRVTGMMFGNLGSGYFDVGPDRTPAFGYVQSGLVAQWDGIENAGWGVHDPNGGLVEILSGTATYLRQGSLEVRGDCIRLETAVLASSPIPAIVNLDGSGDLTIEACIEWDKNGRAIQWVNGRPFNSGMFSNNYTYYMSHSACTDSELQGRWGSGFHDYREHRSLTISNTTVQWYQEGVATTSAPRTKNFETTNNVFSLFGWDFDYGFPGSGEICAIRVYSRALTAAEIAANNAVDKGRFNLP